MKWIIGMFLVFACGCGVNVVQLKSQTASSTGWYDEHGEVVTTEHMHKGVARAIGANGYVSGELMPQRRLAFDVMAYGPTVHTENRCYGEARVGDWVTTSTLRGPVRAKITRVEYFTFYVSHVFIHGDSGAPASHRGCILGVLRSNTDVGAKFVKLSGRE